MAIFFREIDHTARVKYSDTRDSPGGLILLTLASFLFYFRWVDDHESVHGTEHQAMVGCVKGGVEVEVIGGQSVLGGEIIEGVVLFDILEQSLTGAYP